MQNIQLNEIDTLRSEYLENDKARVVRHALTENDIALISRSLGSKVNNPNFFSIDLKTMPVTNQLQSGRCWIFSGLNILREILGKKYNIKEFELSQNYVAFYDKLEKANWFMNCVISEKDAPANSETNRFLLESAVSDGGQWNMLVSLIKKYGIAPKTAMPETFQSSHTRNLNALLNRRLRKFASDIRKIEAEEIEQYRKSALKEIYTLLADSFGVPPMKFDFVYYDKEDTYHIHRDITPTSFYRDWLGEDLDAYVYTIHAPTKDKPYHKNYSVKYLGNVVDGEEIKMYNVTLAEFKTGIINQLKAGEPVWFGCDCGPDGDRQYGLWDDMSNDFAFTFDMDLAMSKEDMLDYRQSAMNHAMVLTGVNLEDEKPTRWKIENSWGDKIANKGYFIASDSWFDKYMYVAAVKKQYLPESALEGIDSPSVELSPWDPFGTLAD